MLNARFFINIHIYDRLFYRRASDSSVRFPMKKKTSSSQRSLYFGFSLFRRYFHFVLQLRFDVERFPTLTEFGVFEQVGQSGDLL